MSILHYYSNEEGYSKTIVLPIQLEMHFHTEK